MIFRRENQTHPIKLTDYQMPKLIVYALLFVSGFTDVMQPDRLQPYMFKQEITGDLNPLKPSKLKRSQNTKFPTEVYEISMVKAKHQFLPEGFPATTIFAYAGRNKYGIQPTFPGPAIIAMKDTPIEIIWTNQIKGTHILPVDLNKPFGDVKRFIDTEVPVVPHMHGLENEPGSDGQPFGFWTRSGKRGRQYYSLPQVPKKSNQAVYRHFNNFAGLFWYHDHTIGITRLNVYAGLAGGPYEVIDPEVSSEERNIMKIYGDLQRKFFTITDKSFQENGELYYPNQSENRDFSSWVPEFFGNTITVNGKVWPKVKLQRKKYRLVFLNACQSRYLNIHFEDSATIARVEFDLIRTDADYFRKPVTTSEHFLLISSRIEIVVDFSQVRGDIIIKNNAPAPYPEGAPEFLVDQFTGQIMKIEVIEEKRVSQAKDFPQQYSSQYKYFNQYNNLGPYRNPGQVVKETILKLIKSRLFETNPNLHNVDLYSKDNSIDYAYYPTDPIFNSWPFNSRRLLSTHYLQPYSHPYVGNIKSNSYQNNLIKQDQRYPTLSEGQPYFPVLLNTQNQFGETASIMIDGVSMQLGDRCAGSTFKAYRTYDFYIINLTEDEHPMHIHLANFEVIGRYDFDLQGYQRDYLYLNGPLTPRGFKKHPKQLDVREYLKRFYEPLETQKLMRDVIGASTRQVTLVRVNFGGRNKNGYPFEIRGTNYVWHCHILEHEDNQMMRWFCIQ